MALTLALDFETYYDHEYSVVTLGEVLYTRDPRFHAYCVSMVGDDGREWVGKPVDAPWDWLKAADTALAHNIGFEVNVVIRLMRDGVIPEDCLPGRWRDTADMCAFLNLHRQRRLDSVAKAIGVTMTKAARDDALGVAPETYYGSPALWAEICGYCMDDSRMVMRLWERFSAKWPEDEQLLAELTFLGRFRGIAIDIPHAVNARTRLGSEVRRITLELPWVSRTSQIAIDGTNILPKLGKPLSSDAFRGLSTQLGMSFPVTTKRDDDDFIEFVETYRERYPWVAYPTALRSVNRTEKLMDKIVTQTTDGGIGHFGLRYCGAHTGRWSGEGVNLQNLNAKPVLGIDLRETFRARRGMTFVIYDYAQIEPRTLFWRVGDEGFIDRLRTGQSPYEAYARAYMGWTGGKLKDENPPLYKMAKAILLGLGYGMGPDRFIGTLPVDALAAMVGSDPEKWLAYAKMTVSEYRSTNYRVCDHWRESEQFVSACAGKQVCEVPLCSGRSLRYWYPVLKKQVRPGSTRMNLQLQVSNYPTTRKVSGTWGGKLVENEIQALARDVVRDAVVRVYRETDEFPVFSSHDEVIYEVPACDADAWYTYLGRELVVTPAWADGLPLAVEGNITDRYLKD